MEYANETTYTIDKRSVVFKYVEKPTLIQKMKIIDDITTGVINDTVGYEPILFDYFLTVALVNNLTNVKLPMSFTESVEFIEKTRIHSILEECIDPSDISSIISSSQDKISFRKQQIANSSKVDELFGALATLVNKYAESFEGIDIKDVIEKLQSINDLAKVPQEQIVHSILKYEDSKKKESD